MGILGFLHFIILVGVFLFVVTVGCIIAVSLMPKENPLYELLSGLTRKLAMTLGLAMVAPVAQLLPLADVAFDIGTPLYLIYTWSSFIKSAIAEKLPQRRQGGTPINPRADEIEVLPASRRRIGNKRQVQTEPPEEVESTF